MTVSGHGHMGVGSVLPPGGGGLGSADGSSGGNSSYRVGQCQEQNLW